MAAKIKRVHVNGYIDVPDAWEFPEIDFRIDLRGGTLVVKGDSRNKRGRGDTSEITYTLESRLEGGKLGKVHDPEPEIEGQGSLDDAGEEPVGEPEDDVTKARRGRGRTGKDDG